MKIIERIVIENFRSLKLIDININDINVFSGLNDTGKSNILKALNFFFNGETDFLTPLKFSNDFSKITLASAQRSGKQKQQIKIRVYFNIPSSFPSLRNEQEVFIEKVVTREGDASYYYSTDDIKKKAQITRLFNKIKYFYIPALKGPDVLRFVLGKIGEHQLISSDEINKLNKEVNVNLSDLKSILSLSAIATKTSMGFPVLVRDFWEKLTINTQYDEFDDLQNKTKVTAKGKDDPLKDEFYQIPLELRGEGIKSKYIPPLLKWLQERDSSIYIWGIDEPENSLEFRKAEELADLYFNNYADKTQLFLTTHSLAFIFGSSLRLQTSMFRCVKGDLGKTDVRSLQNLFSIQNKLELAEEVGALEIQKELYKDWQEKDIELKQTQRLIADLQTKNRPALYVEGKTDKKILESAWGKLYPGIVMPFDIEQCGGATYLLNYIKNPGFNPSNIAVALWDCDEKGYASIMGLFNKHNFLKQSYGSVKHGTKKIYGMVLPAPTIRSQYVNLSCEKAQFQFFEIEHYFSDAILTQNNMIEDTVDGKIILKESEFELSILPNNEFNNFSILFDELKKIMKY